MATTAEINVYNEALGLIGELAITSSTLTTEPQYRICDRFYVRARNEMLSRHIWNEATAYSILLQDTTAPLHTKAYRFVIPSDCLRVLYIGNDLYDWEAVGGYIYTDYAGTPSEWISGEDYIAGQYVNYNDITYLVNTSVSDSTVAPDTDSNFTSQGGSYGILNIQYIKTMTDPEEWSEGLRHCITLNLASKISVGLTQDTKLKQQLLEELERLVFPQAKAIDGMQGTPKPYFNSSWLRARTTQW